MRAAVAVELVHSATLVHDDLIDGAPLRRGRPTVAAAAGRGARDRDRRPAVLARVRRAGAQRGRRAAAGALGGQLGARRRRAAAARGRLRADVAVERYLRRCELKTAALFEAACRLGALGRATVGGAGRRARRVRPPHRARLPAARRRARRLRAGRAHRQARGTDLLDGTVTLPLILAREREPELAELDLRVARGARSRPRRCASGSRPPAPSSEARERALAVVAGAKAALPAVLPEGRAALLELVADAVVERYR